MTLGSFPPVYMNDVLIVANPEFGGGGEFPLPYYMQLNATNQAREIVGKGAKAIGATIKAVRVAASPLLDGRERTRLEALEFSLDTIGDALIAGSMDWASARPAMKSAFSLALDEAGGRIFAVIFGAIGTYAAANSPLPPQAKTIIIGASGLAGYAIGEAANNAWVDTFAGWLTDGIFYGAEAMGWLMYNLIEAVKLGLDPVSWEPSGMPARPNISVTDEQVDGSFYMSGAF